jgi:hypothetical protein
MRKLAEPPYAQTRRQEIMMPIPQVIDRLKETPAMVLRAVFAGIGQVLMAADKVRGQLEEQFAPQAPASPPPGQAGAERQQAEAPGNVTLLSDRQGPGGQRAHTRPASPVAPARATAAKPAAKPAAAKPAAAKPAAQAKAAASKTATAKPATANAAKPATAKATATAKAATRPAAAKPAAAKPAAARPAAAKPAAAKPAAARAATRPAAAKPANARAATPKPAPPIADYDSLSIASLRARLRGLGPDGVRALLDYERATAHRDDVIAMYERRLTRLADQTG